MTERVVPAFSRKRVDEDLPLTYDFANDLPSDVAISATGTTTAAVAADSAVTDGSPSAIVSGTASYSGTQVTQKIINGTDGCKYFLVFEVTGDDGNKYHGEATLLIKDES
jgi:hypothetical protein